MLESRDWYEKREFELYVSYEGQENDIIIQVLYCTVSYCMIGFKNGAVCSTFVNADDSCCAVLLTDNISFVGAAR